MFVSDNDPVCPALTAPRPGQPLLEKPAAQISFNLTFKDITGRFQKETIGNPLLAAPVLELFILKYPHE